MYLLKQDMFHEQYERNKYSHSTMYLLKLVNLRFTPNAIENSHSTMYLLKHEEERLAMIAE